MCLACRCSRARQNPNLIKPPQPLNTRAKTTKEPPASGHPSPHCARRPPANLPSTAALTPRHEASASSHLRHPCVGAQNLALVFHPVSLDFSRNFRGMVTAQTQRKQDSAVLTRSDKYQDARGTIPCRQYAWIQMKFYVRMHSAVQFHTSVAFFFRMQLQHGAHLGQGLLQGGAFCTQIRLSRRARMPGTTPRGNEEQSKRRKHATIHNWQYCSLSHSPKEEMRSVCGH